MLASFSRRLCCFVVATAFIFRVRRFVDGLAASFVISIQHLGCFHFSSHLCFVGSGAGSLVGLCHASRFRPDRCLLSLFSFAVFSAFS